ncbi:MULTISPECIES: mechanosensitive ion channel family protein [Cellulophaga]|uniref:MscS Mechanosensitive ion channel n=2 Tax=Cellulophaga TaxID=104264 RepID=F0RHQ6_CELLC|nr:MULTISPECIES: mechanosensitive ion channel domain-containing protein [Cellulophaga]ADY28165.1 MscS Mechanosensitive ion channel [Cellulophaga lytica DSM 7489]AIM59240.1 mechanosensitive ion channel protein MscS [Cellulophaga lytica]APU09054.1 mechanosensitive ion channel protein MscS [Cellulophaga lytica]EWH12754.1 mechanosensitive ion channel protein MscS [Cellulophaga geojensis KL-A]MDO6853641.1 mechanosensitive ion channel [Cellulophaga lytica]
MKDLKDIFKYIMDFMSYKLVDSDKVDITIGTLFIIIIVLVVVTYLLKLIHKIVIAKLPQDDKNKFLSIFSFLKYFLYILAVITVLHSSGVDLTVLLTASAALFVGLGFALQYLFQDIISGILIILDQSLHIGDIIEVEGKVGRVFETRLRTTRALTRDDKVIVIPNHKFLTDSIYNYTQNHKTTRENVKVGVAYGSDVELVSKLLLEIIDTKKGILKNPKPFVLFEDFGDSALMFSINYYTNDSYGDPRIKSDLRFLIDAAFRENNISIPFPQRDIHIISK